MELTNDVKKTLIERKLMGFKVKSYELHLDMLAVQAVGDEAGVVELQKRIDALAAAYKAVEGELNANTEPKLQRDLEWLLANLDSLNVRKLTADVIDAGTLNANLVTIRSDLTSGYIQLDGSGMIVNNGSFNTFTVDLNGNVVMTSATIQSSTGYPKVVMNPLGDLFGAYLDGNNYLEIQPSYSPTGSPTMYWVAGGSTAGELYAETGVFLFNVIARELTLRTEIQGNIVMQPEVGYSVILPSLFSTIMADTGLPLLATMAQIGNSTSAVGNHNHGIPSGTQLLDADGVTTHTFVSSGGHSHIQT